MKNFPTFSIITITLNNFDGFKKTAKSIENQTFSNYEWLVIDGGSTDKTIDFLREKRSNARQDKYPFTFTSEKDDGIYDAMNKGISSAKGRYLIFLNAGDELACSNILEKIAPLTAKKPDFIYGDSLEPYKNKSIYKSARNHKDIAWGMFTHHQAMIYSRHKVRDHKMHYSLRYKISSDYDFTARFLQKFNNISYINQPICIFEQGGISQKNAALGRKEQYIIRENLNMVTQPKNLWVLISQSLSWRLKSISPSIYNALKVFTIK